MRAFEVVLILLNLLALLMTFKPPSQAVWSGLAVVTIVMLSLHGMFEGFRYQMTFSYALVVLLVFCAVVKRIGVFPSGRLQWYVARVALAGAFVLLAATSALAYALPVFALPAPTGDYAVGIKYFHLIDETRMDPFLDTAPRQRELMVKICYPARPDEAKPFSRYFRGSLNLLQAFASFYGLPSFAFSHLTLVTTHGKEELELSDNESSYPVVLISHGAGTTMEVETSQSEDLASHGYIVVDIDHTYVSAATAFPDRIATAAQATTSFDAIEPAESITQIMADDDAFVIDTLAEMNDGAIDADFNGRLNLGEIGVIGHSVGGAVAYNMAIGDSRVKAAINLDGAVYVVPRSPTAIAPFLMLANDRYHVQAIEHRTSLLEALAATPAGQQTRVDTQVDDVALTTSRQNITGLADVLAASGNLYTIAGSDHMKFADIGLFIGDKRLREFMQIGGQTDPERCLEITRAITTAFFDQRLKHQTADALQSLLRIYPELEQIDLH